MRWILLVVVVSLDSTSLCEGHPHPDHRGHRAPTYEVTDPIVLGSEDKRLVVHVVDSGTDKLTAARLSIWLDGKQYVPTAVNRHGIRFVSIHTSKKQRSTVVYSRGSGPLAFAIPRDARQGEVVVTKGYEYLPERVSFRVEGNTTTIHVRLKRWSKLREAGWLPADEHLHYERLDPKHDADWLDMLAGDGLTHAHFMVLKGGNLPGVWAQQYAYGKKGQATDGQRTIVPGEEFRDRRQGHINLLGLGSVIQPISSGGMGKPPHPFNFPTLHDVILEARSTGGIGGPAHGGALAKNSTAIVDTVLGAVEFFEIANTHLYKTDVWYRLMNCGFVVPPAAGTDLPNFPFRDDWQPMLGETRMYVRVGEKRDFDSWKQAVRRGEVFVSSGPLVRLTINGVGPGGTVELPEKGGRLKIEAELASPQPLSSFELIRKGQPIEWKVQRSEKEGIHRWILRGELEVDASCWLAARGSGIAKEALKETTRIEQNAIAHTAAIRVAVGGKPIVSRKDATALIEELTAHREAYRAEGKFRLAKDRERLLELFHLAIKKLIPQTTPHPQR